jgi:hypothetical protein
MNGNLFTLLLIVMLALSLVVRCDVRHAAGETGCVTPIQQPCASRGTSPGAQPPRLPAPGHAQKGGPHGPARPEATLPEDVQ